MSQKGLIPIVISLAIVIVVGTAIVGYLLFKHNYLSGNNRHLTCLKVDNGQTICLDKALSDFNPSYPISPSPSPLITNWKTYTNQKYGYSIKYPPDWKLTDCYLDAAGKNVCSGTRDEITWFFPKLCCQIDIYYSGYALSDLQYYPHKNSTINGYKVIITTALPSNEPVYSVFFIHKGVNDSYVDFNFYPYDEKTASMNQKQTFQEFEEMLSTFKFTDQSPQPSVSCLPRPACLDATPRCMIAEPASGWCTK